jgi:hypothetical protein
VPKASAPAGTTVQANVN